MQSIRDSMPVEYQITWREEKEKYPVIIKYSGIDIATTILSWRLVLEKLSGCKAEFKAEKYTIRISYEDKSFLATIYENATVMLQGKGNGRWLEKNVKEIVTELPEMLPQKEGKKKTGLLQLKARKTPKQLKKQVIRNLASEPEEDGYKTVDRATKGTVPKGDQHVAENLVGGHPVPNTQPKKQLPQLISNSLKKLYRPSKNCLGEQQSSDSNNTSSNQCGSLPTTSATNYLPTPSQAQKSNHLQILKKVLDFEWLFLSSTRLA